MKQKPIATIMRESLPKDSWMTGFSKTYQDISYTKTTKTKRWATKDIHSLTRLQTKAVTRKLTEALAGRGLDIQVSSSQLTVTEKTPVSIVELA